MTPSKPGDPSQGKPDAEKAELEAKESAEAVAEQAAEQKAAASEAPAGEEAAAADAPAADAAAEEAPAADAPAADAAAEDAAAEEAPAADAPAAADAAAEAKPKRARAEKADAPEAEVEAKPKRSRGKKTEKAPAKREAARPARTRSRTPGERVVVRAQAKYVRSSARKARMVCDHIRGKDVATARAILAYSPRSVAEAWSKLLESAVANAENNHDLVGDDLKIVHVYADEGPTIKRFRPRAMGRATKILKRTSHLSIALTPKDVASGGKEGAR